MATAALTGSTKIDYAPPVLDLDNFPHGDTLDLFFDEITDEDTGNPIDLTTGTAEMRFEDKNGVELVTLTDGAGITLGVGTLQIKAETAAWPQNCTAYSDFQFTPAGGNIETWFKVIARLKKSITTPV